MRKQYIELPLALRWRGLNIQVSQQNIRLRGKAYLG